MATAEQTAWIERVLGISLTGLTGASDAVGDAEEAGRPWSELLPLWREAKDEVDGDIGRLQAALRATGDDDLEQIADAGLYGVTTGEAVRLQAALRDADKDGGSPAARKKVLTAIGSYRDFLDGAPIVGLLERNDWQSVPLRRVLGGALAQMERLAAA